MPKDKMDSVYELMNKKSLESASLYRTIKEAPVVGNISREDIKRAVVSISDTQATEAGKKVMEKYAKAIENLGDR